MMYRIFLLSIIFLFSGSGWTQPNFPTSVKPPFTTIFPNSKAVHGDLTDDGIDDFAVLLTEKSESENFDRIAIYIGRSDGSYELAAKSLNLEYGTVDFEIKKKSLFITAFHNSLNKSNSETYQFKYRKNGFFLIGKEEYSYTPDDGNKFVVSENYLTGKKIEKQTIRNKTSKAISQLSNKETMPIRLDEFSR